MKKTKNALNGWVVLDKDLDLTSTQALGRLKRLLNPMKAGHAGTLDPLATGCLPIALGEATKTVQYAQHGRKTYEFEVSWGESRTTDDLEGDVVDFSDLRPSQEDVQAILPDYTGRILQTPPQFAAVKINGERAYDIARDGGYAEIKPREVNVHAIEILSHQDDKTRMRAICGKGVYIRAFARDMGAQLGCFGHISDLRRLNVDPFSEDMMITLDNLEKIVHSGDLQTALLPVETALDDIPVLDLTDEEASRVRQGGRLEFIGKPQLARMEKAGIALNPEQMCDAYVTNRGVPLALVEIKGIKIKPVRVFNL